MKPFTKIIYKIIDKNLSPDSQWRIGYFEADLGNKVAIMGKPFIRKDQIRILEYSLSHKNVICKDWDFENNHFFTTGAKVLVTEKKKENDHYRWRYGMFNRIEGDKFIITNDDNEIIGDYLVSWDNFNPYDIEETLENAFIVQDGNPIPANGLNI